MMKDLLILTTITLTFIGCSQAKNNSIETKSIEQNNIFSFNLPEPSAAQLGDKQGLWATYYFLPQVRSVEKNGYALLDLTGKELGPVLSLKDWCSSASLLASTTG